MEYKLLLERAFSSTIPFMASTKKTFILYFLLFFLTLGWAFIGWNFAGNIGATMGTLFAVIVAVYALQIEEEE